MQPRQSQNKGKDPASVKFTWIIFLTGITGFSPMLAATTAQQQAGIPNIPAISIIIDDLGNDDQAGQRVIKLPGLLTCAFLPHTPHAQGLAELAFHSGKEILLHQPMEAMLHNALGPGGLTMDLSHRQFIEVLNSNMASIPHIAGINNHMGSLLTQHPAYMQWLMHYISQYDELFFVDSYTTAATVVAQIATENWIPNMRRDIFLDNDRNPSSIEQQFDRLLSIAAKNGRALAIGHPYPETLTVLEKRLPKLRQSGYRLISVSQLLNEHVKRFKAWRAFLYP